MGNSRGAPRPIPTPKPRLGFKAKSSMKRYSEYIDWKYEEFEMIEDTDGEWVKYKDIKTLFASFGSTFGSSTLGINVLSALKTRKQKEIV